MKSYSVTILMKATEQYFLVVLLIICQSVQQQNITVKKEQHKTITSSNLRLPCCEKNEIYVHPDDDQRSDETNNKEDTF